MASKAQDSPSGPASARRLADARSAYLRSAQEQAIDWYPWGEEPFEVAKRTNRPILLDIGAAWCHWCHVMDEGTYTDPEVARLLRQHFVAVKVDRDEHPEVDRRFQREVGVLTGEGGWPLTAFLTPKGEVFLGGTYFPAQDGMGRPGLRRVLKEIAVWWRDEPDKVRDNVGAVRAALERMQESGHHELGKAPGAFVQSVRAALNQSYDPVHGGFGLAPKFPHPTAISFLLWDGFASGSEESANRARETLLRMAEGGVYDQLGGGFHRYSVDEGWHIPHFEKMASDNAPLLAAYTEAARRFDDPRLDDTVRGIVDWVLEVLAVPSGGFGASQDADNAPGDDGSYFTWSRAELKGLLTTEELRLVSRVFGIGSDGRMPHDPDQNVLFRLMPVLEAAEGGSTTADRAVAVLDRALKKLREARARRPTPAVDLAMYASVNGSLIRALAAASRWTGDARSLKAAQAAADRFLNEAFHPGRGVAHRLDPQGAEGYGLLDDQAEFAWGLIELAGTTLQPRYLETARTLLELIDREFRGENGLLRDLAPSLYSGPSVGSLGVASYPLEDSPHLSANAAAAHAFLRYSSLTGQEPWRDKARALLGPIQARIGHAGLFAAGSALAAGLLETPPARVVVEGSGARANALLRAAERSWHPNLWVFRGVPPEPFSSAAELVAQAGGGGEARALICFGTRCLAPVTDPDQIRPLLLSAGRGPAA